MNAFVQPEMTALAALTGRQSYLSASRVVWERIWANGIPFSPDVGVVFCDVDGPPLVFYPDGSATHGGRTWNWKTCISSGLSERTWRVTAKKLLDVDRSEAQRWRVLALRRRVLDRYAAMIQTVHDAGPVIGIYREGTTEERHLCAHPSSRDEEPSIALRSARGNETRRDDLAELYFIRLHALYRANKLLNVMDELVLSACARVLPEMPKAGQIACVTANGRPYWLVHEARNNGRADSKARWYILAFPETEVVRFP